jgi:hypothetical protein
MEELPTDAVRGVDFRITKTSKGGYADYSTSKWSRRERALDEAERAAIDKFGLFNLSDFRPKKPTDAEVKIIKELFEKSVEGEAYDLEKYGQYFRPAGVSATANGSANGSASVTAPVDGEAIVTKVEAVKAAPAAAAPQPSTDSAKRAEDILKLIRSRQSK